MGTWFSLFNNWETFIGQFIALVLVLGSYRSAEPAADRANAAVAR